MPKLFEIVARVRAAARFAVTAAPAFALLLALAPAFAPARDFASPLSPNELAELAGQVFISSRDLSEGAALARQNGLQVAARGATSRELLAFVERRVKQIGKEKFLEEIKAGKVSMFEWHRVGRPLHLVVLDGGKNPAKAKEVAAALAEKNKSHRFHAGWAIETEADYAAKVRAQNFLPTEHILLGEKGLAGSGAHKVTVEGGKSVNLGEAGLEAFTKRETLYYTNPERAGGVAEDLRTFLRMVQEAAEFPSERGSEARTILIRQYYANRIAPNEGEAKRLLELGGTLRTRPRNAPESLLRILEEAQAYAYDLADTRKLIAATKLESLVEAAGLKTERLFQPLGTNRALPEHSRAEANGKPPSSIPGDQPIRIAHATTGAGLQNLYGGAWFESANGTVIDGNKGAAVEGPALYTTGTDTLQQSYGVHQAELEIRGRDGFTAYPGKDWYLVTDPAVVRQSLEKLREEGFDRESFLERQKGRLRELAARSNFADDADKVLAENLARSYAHLIAPEEHAADVARFADFLKQLRAAPLDALQLDRRFLLEYAQNPGVLTRLYAGKNPAFAEIAKELAALAKDPEMAPHLRVILAREGIRNPKAFADAIRDEPALAALHSEAKALLAKDPDTLLKTSDKKWRLPPSWSQSAVEADPAYLSALRALNPAAWRAKMLTELKIARFDFSDPSHRELLADSDPKVRERLRKFLFIDDYDGQGGDENEFMLRQKADFYARSLDALPFEQKKLLFGEILGELAGPIEYGAKAGILGMLQTTTIDRELCASVCARLLELMAAEDHPITLERYAKVWRGIDIPDELLRQLLADLDGADAAKQKVAKLVLGSLSESAYARIPDSDKLRLRVGDRRLAEKLVKGNLEERARILGFLREPDAVVNAESKQFLLNEIDLMTRSGPQTPTRGAAIVASKEFAEVLDVALGQCAKPDCLEKIKSLMDRATNVGNPAVTASVAPNWAKRAVAVVDSLQSPKELESSIVNIMLGSISDPNLIPERDAALARYLVRLAGTDVPGDERFARWRSSTISSLADRAYGMIPYGQRGKPGSERPVFQSVLDALPADHPSRETFAALVAGRSEVKAPAASIGGGQKPASSGGRSDPRAKVDDKAAGGGIVGAVCGLFSKFKKK